MLKSRQYPFAQTYKKAMSIIVGEKKASRIKANYVGSFSSAEHPAFTFYKFPVEIVMAI